MKRIITLFAAAMVVLSLSACGKKAPPSAPTAELNKIEVIS